MKKGLALLLLSIFFVGCINPSKEARIQKLEAEALDSRERINQLEAAVKDLKSSNAQLQSHLSQGSAIENTN